MSKYFDTKPGSLEEAVSAAQQAAIAISKKERGEKPKDEKDEGNAFGAALMAAKEKGEKTFTVAGKTYDVKTEQEIKEYVQSDGVKRRVKEGDQRLKSNKLNEKKPKLDPVGKADADIDNDGDVDDSDKYLAKRRKAIGKAMKKGESVTRNVAETVVAMWQEAAKKNEEPEKDDEKEEKPKKNGKTDTGKEMTPIETSVKMPKTKDEKNKV